MLEIKYKKNGFNNPEIEAIRMITKFEGLIFWFAVNPDANVVNLINKI